MPGRRGRRAARRAWVPSRQRSAAAGNPHLARSRGEDRPLSASDEAQEGGGGGEGVKVKSSEAAAGPWAAASAGCFDHGGAVAVSFCSRGSSRAAGRPPWGPALPRPPAPPIPGGQHPGGRTRGSARPPAGPSRRPLLSAPAAPRAAASCWGGGRRPAPAAACLAAGPGGLGPVPGRPGNGGSAPASALRSPPRPAPRLALTHPTHAHSWPEAMLRSGWRAGAQSDGHALPRPGRAPAAAATPVHTRGTRARTAYTRTHGPRTRSFSTRARTPTHAHRHAGLVHPPCTRFPPPRNRWPWNLVTSAATPFPSWVR